MMTHTNFEHDNTPLFTVIVASYNRLSLLPEAIDSVLVQDYENIQLIVADDASKGFDAAAVEERIRRGNRGNIRSFGVIEQKYNVGTVRNLNEACKLAVGEYCVVLDDDDLFASSDVISRVAAEFQRTDLELIFTSSIAFDKQPRYLIPHYIDRKRLTRRHAGARAQHESLITGFHYSFITGMWFFKRRCPANGNQYDESYKYIEDYPFILKYTLDRAAAFDFEIIGKKYRLGGISDPHSTVSEEYQKDLDRLFYVGCCERSDELSPAAQKHIEYYKRKLKAGSSAERLKIYIRYAPIAFRKILYKLHKAFAMFIDKLMILIGTIGFE